MKREQFIGILASTYYKFLTHLAGDIDENMMLALKEARTKFLANLHIEIAKKELPKGKTDRRYATDYVSEDAEKKLSNGIVKGLRFEHLVPKSRYITTDCEQKAMEGTLTLSFVKSCSIVIIGLPR